jgi:tRNA threonylcarbamoyladenosine biosynthesis protein TsaB
MKILAVDTSTEICNVCILDGDRIAAEYISKSSQTHTERLLPAIQNLLSELKWEPKQLEGLAVVNGPGSFTGLRIGLSVVKGLALALDLKVVTGNALHMAALQVPGEGWICPVMDARRGEVFSCLYQRIDEHFISFRKPVSIQPESMLEWLPHERGIRFCGPGAYLYSEVFAKRPYPEFVFQDFILACTLAYYAKDEFSAGHAISGMEVQAAYLRPSDAETKGARPRKRLDQIPRR